MEEYHCPECNKKIEYETKVCPHCHEEIDWVDTKKEPVQKIVYYRPIHKDLVDTYNFLLNSATAVLVVILAIAGLLFIFGFILSIGLYDTSDELGTFGLLSTFITCGVLVLVAIVVHRTLKYKGYMLKSIHEINLKLNNKTK